LVPSQLAGGRHVVTMPWTMLGHSGSVAEIPHPQPPLCLSQERGLFSPPGVVLPSPRAWGEGPGMRGF
jgi:hypothetical protein